MGHSYIDYGERSRVMHDGQITAICYVMMDVARREGTKLGLTPNVQSLLESWESLVEDSAPGCIDLDLDRFLVAPADRDSLRKLAGQARTYVEGLAPQLPGAYLNKLVNASHLMEFDDQPAAKILAAYDAFITVLDGS